MIASSFLWAYVLVSGLRRSIELKYLWAIFNVNGLSGSMA